MALPLLAIAATAAATMAVAKLIERHDAPQSQPGLSNEAMIAMANASKDAQIAQSNNSVMMAQSQAATAQLGILKNSHDAQFQTLAWLTTRLDSHDTKIQIALENAKISHQRGSDHHDEAMKGLANDARELDIRKSGTELTNT